MSSTLSKAALLDRVHSAIEDSGGNYRSIQGRHPFVSYVFDRDESERFRVYIWNITPGGRSRPPDEYRIQLTGVGHSIKVTPPIKTLLLGWDSRFEVFAGWNASRYSAFGGSPSLQVKNGTLEKAARDGFAVQSKERDRNGDTIEVVVAFTPEQFLTYAFNLEAYHQQQIDSTELEVIQKAADRRLTDADLNILPELRRRQVRQFNQAVRDRRFRKGVLQVYNNRCAVCRLQLKLVEAAHIVPVKNDGTDEIVNGIALCPTHHLAFDQGLILLSVSNQIMLIDQRVTALKVDRFSGGLGGFRDGLNLGKTIYLPPDRKYRPKTEYIEKRLRLERYRLKI